LKNTLDKLDPVHSLIDISLANAKPAVLGRDEKSGEQKLGYLFKSAISEDRYFAEFMPRIREVLTQVAIGAPRQISLSVSGRQGLEFEKCFNAGMSGDHALRSQRCGATIVSPKLGEMSSAGSSSFSSQQHPCAVLVTKANKLRTVYSCEVYELDKHAAETLTGWWRDRMPSDYDSLIARLSFVDDEDEVLVQARVELGSCRWRMSCWLESFGNSIQSCMVIAPWFVQLSSFECYDWGKVSLPKEALPLVKKIKIDIVK